MTYREGHRFELRMDAELPQEISDVRLHRLRADEELARDVLVPEALGQQAEDLPLPVGELRQEQLGVPPGLSFPGHPGQKPRQGGAVDQDLASCRGLQGAEEFVDALRLAEEPGGPGLHRVDEKALVLV